MASVYCWARLSMSANKGRHLAREERMRHRVAVTLMLSALLAVVGTAVASEDEAQGEPDPPSPESAERGPSTSSFYSGSEFRGLPDKQRLIYIAAVVEGMTFSGSAIRSELEERLSSSKARALMKRFERMNRCASDMRLDQLSDTVDGYVADHPEQWHRPMFDIVWAALRDVCDLQSEQ